MICDASIGDRASRPPTFRDDETENVHMLNNLADGLDVCLFTDDTRQPSRYMNVNKQALDVLDMAVVVVVEDIVLTGRASGGNCGDDRGAVIPRTRTKGGNGSRKSIQS